MTKLCIEIMPKLMSIMTGYSIINTTIDIRERGNSALLIRMQDQRSFIFLFLGALLVCARPFLPRVVGKGK